MLITLIIAIELGITRVWLGFNVEPDEFSLGQAYKDIAHIFIGGVMTAWYIQRHKWQLYIAIGLTVLEVIVATLSRI